MNNVIPCNGLDDKCLAGDALAEPPGRGVRLIFFRENVPEAYPVSRVLSASHPDVLAPRLAVEATRTRL